MKYELYKYDIVSIYDGEESGRIGHYKSLRKANKRLRWFLKEGNGVADSYIIKYHPRLIKYDNKRKAI